MVQRSHWSLCKSSEYLIGQFARSFFIHWGGGGAGGAKDYERSCTSRAQSPKSILRPGSRAGLRALEALGVFHALSCYLRLIFLSILKQDGIKKTIADHILRVRLLRAPLNPPLDFALVWKVFWSPCELYVSSELYWVIIATRLWCRDPTDLYVNHLSISLVNLLGVFFIHWDEFKRSCRIKINPLIAFDASVDLQCSVGPVLETGHLH